MASGPSSVLDAFGQSRKDFREIFERAAARPVEVGPVLEDHVDVGEAEVGEAADGLDLRGTQHRGDDRIGDLILDDVRASVPAGVDDDLRIGQIGNRVQRHLTHPVVGPDDGHQSEDDHQVLVAGTELDDAVNHGLVQAFRPVLVLHLGMIHAGHLLLAVA